MVPGSIPGGRTLREEDEPPIPLTTRLLRDSLLTPELSVNPDHTIATMYSVDATDRKSTLWPCSEQ